ncbi:hypothetical protein HRbin36_00097 [bacterium HR36]|nr:hypothetical protein HRbin36_00097 [bacterium HR36]
MKGAMSNNHRLWMVPLWLVHQPPVSSFLPFVFSAPLPSDLATRPCAIIINGKVLCPCDCFHLNAPAVSDMPWLQFATVLTPEITQSDLVEIAVTEYTPDGALVQHCETISCPAVSLDKFDNAIRLTFSLGSSLISRMRLEAPRVILNNKYEVQGMLKYYMILRAGRFVRLIRFLIDFPECRSLIGWLDIVCWTFTPFVRWEYRLTNRNAAEHRSGLWDLGDKSSLSISSLGLSLYSEDDLHEVYYSLDGEEKYQQLDCPELLIHQESSGSKYWQHANHVTQSGRLPFRFAGAVAETEKATVYATKFGPVWSHKYLGHYLTVTLDPFWSAFPRAVRISRDCAVIEALPLLPPHCRQLYELQGGECLRLRGVIFNSPNGLPNKRALEWYKGPCHAFPTWDYLLKCKALTTFGIYGTPRESKWIQYISAFDIIQELETKVVQQDELGWRHLGDIPADHERVYYRRSSPFVSHFNNQYDLLAGLLYLLLYSRDSRLLDLIHGMSRHIADIDVYHTDKDRSAYNHGLFWHTDHYKSAGLATHRSFSRTQGSGQITHGGGPSCEHLYSTGLCIYYLLTGESWARDTVLELADFVISCDDGGQTGLRYLDKGPTGLASRTRDDDYHGPGRGPGNAIEALLNAWLLTADIRYWHKIRDLIHRCIHPSDDVASLGLLDAERRWSYTVFLEAVLRFLHIAAQNRVLDATVFYATQALVQYAKWMVVYERPYLENAHQLEYPTETWPCQDLRKSLILRATAQLANSLWSRRMLDKAAEISQAAWIAIAKFSTRYMTRPIALLLNVGFREACLAGCQDNALPASLVENTQYGAWPPRQKFLPIQRRILAKLPAPCRWVLAVLRGWASRINKLVILSK